MATRAQVLADPRSGAREGAGRPGRPARPAPDQRSRDDLAAARKAAGAGRGLHPPGQDDRPPRDDLAGARARRVRAQADRPRPEPRARGGADASPSSPRDASTSAAAEGAGDEAAAGSAGSPSAAEPSPALASSPRSFATDGAGAFLALLAYPFVINYLRGGMPRAWGWVKAKWINEPYGGGAAASSASQARQHRGAGANLQAARRPG